MCTASDSEDAKRNQTEFQIKVAKRIIEILFQEDKEARDDFFNVYAEEAILRLGAERRIEIMSDCIMSSPWEFDCISKDNEASIDALFYFILAGEMTRLKAQQDK